MQKIIFYIRWIMGIFIFLMGIAVIKNAGTFLILIALLIIPISNEFFQRQSLRFIKKRIPVYVFVISGFLLFIVAIIVSPKDTNINVAPLKVIPTNTGEAPLNGIPDKSLTLEEKKNVYKDVLLAAKIAGRLANQKFPLEIEGNLQKLAAFQSALEEQYTKEILENYKISDSEFLSITTLAMKENWGASFHELGNDSIVYQKEENCLDKDDNIILKLECFNK